MVNSSRLLLIDKNEIIMLSRVITRYENYFDTIGTYIDLNSILFTTIFLFGILI